MAGVDKATTYLNGNGLVRVYKLLTDPFIGAENITLELGANATLVFTWTPPTYGRYEICAEASEISNDAYNQFLCSRKGIR